MIFGRDGTSYVPTGHARGPWDANQQHGGAPCAVLAGAIEALAPDMHLARLAVEFLGAVPLAPFEIGAEIVKKGRRFQLAEATLAAGGRELLRARASLLRVDKLADLPRGTPTEPLLVGPEDSEPIPFPVEGEPEGFHRTAMDIRFASGSFGEPGPAVAWFRLREQLVDGGPASPVQRAVAVADFGNGVSHELDWSEWIFINTDVDVHLHRPPRGEWIALDARTVLEPSGVGLAQSTLHDQEGPIGVAQQTLFVAPRGQ